MKLIEFNIDAGETRRVASPGLCIYCGNADAKLTDEHVIPYALAKNSIILEKSCCETCQRIIQRYEQEVLRKQLGNFRAQVDAPTRSRKDRPTHAHFPIVEIDTDGKVLRDLGTRVVPMDEAPLVLNLWSSPPPRLLRDPEQAVDEEGRAWSFIEGNKALPLVEAARSESGAKVAAMKVGEVNRLHFLRSLAKTAHAAAAAQLGIDAFEPFLTDVILCRSDDVAAFVGDDPSASPPPVDPAQTVGILFGEALDGPGKGLLLARFQLYPELGSPAHLVVVGRQLTDIRDRIDRL